MFRSMLGFQANLQTKMVPGDAVLPLYSGDVARVAAALPDAGDYTRLWVGDSRQHEIVKVTGIVDGAVMIQRGDENSTPLTFPLGTCVSFAWTDWNLADFAQEGFGGAEPAVCEVLAGSDRVEVTKEDCSVTVDVPACDGASWRAGNAEYVQDTKGNITSTPLKTQLTDGEYVNATITVRDGYVTAIESGTNIVYTGGGCCDGGSGGGTGERGPQGEQGPQGQPGIQGPQGPQGPAGARGQQGMEGAQGPAGPTGPTGASILSGNGAPPANVGNVGDFYLDLMTSTLFGPKGASGWPAGVSLVGPKGADGSKGDKGDAGPKGDPGADGKAGNWSLQQSGNVIYVVGPVGEPFTIETENGVQIGGAGAIPANGRAAQAYNPAANAQQTTLFIKSDGLYVGVGSVLV